mgnify:CR=1 FL=1
MELDLFDLIKTQIDNILRSSYLLIPQLEKATTIIAYILLIILFLVFFTLPLFIFKCIFLDNEPLDERKIKRRRKY